MKILHIGMEMMPGIIRGLSKFGGYRFIDWTIFMELGTVGQIALKKEILKISEEMVPDVTFIHAQRPGVITGEIANQLKGFVINYTYDVVKPIPHWFYDVGSNINLTIFCDEDGVSDFHSNGLEAEFCHVGYDDSIFNIDAKIGDHGDIVFLGNNYDESQKFPLTSLRSNMVDFLKKEYGNVFRVYGNKWAYQDGNFMYKEFKEAECYRGCKIAINISHFDLDRYTSDRMFRIMGSGAFCLSKWYPGIEKDFVDGVHLRIWKDLDELKLLIDYYLDDDNEKERNIIANAGYKHVRETAAWEIRIKTIIDMAKIRMSKEYKSRVVKVAQDFRLKPEHVNPIQLLPEEDPSIPSLIESPETYTPLEIKEEIIIKKEEPVIQKQIHSKSPMNSYFDKIYCINLDRRPDKWEKSSEEFAKNNLTVERISGIDGNTLQGKSRINQWELGCLQSHLFILRDIINNNYEKILVLEDDVEFIPNVQQYFFDNLKFIPHNWQMLYFGGNHINPPVKINQAISKISRTYTTSSYGITKNTAKGILNRSEKRQVGQTQIDVLYAEIHHGSNCFTFSPKIAWQRPGWSDVQNGNQDYSGIIK